MENCDASVSHRRDGIRRFGGAGVARARRAPGGRARAQRQAAAASAGARGATPVLGDVMQPASWRAAAAAADGSIHTAAQSGAKARPLDETAVGVLISLPAKDNRFVIYTSSPWVLGPAPAPVDETAPLNPIEIVSWRPAQEKRILDSACNGGRAIVIRPGTLYGGCRGIVGDLMQDGEQPGPNRRQRQEPLAAGLRPGPRRALRTDRKHPHGVRRLSCQRRGGRDGQRHRRRARRARAHSAQHPACSAP